MQAKVNGISINYQLAGKADGPPVVLHHPLATNLTMWEELTAALAPTYRVLRLDARGHGQSEAPKGPYDFETLAADVVALMDAVGFAKARFLGLSMGGMAGQYLGLLHPDRFHSLTLVSTSSRIPAEAAPVWDQRIANARAGGMPSQVQAALERWVSPTALKTRPDLVAWFSGMIAATPVDGYVGWCEAIRRLDITERLKTIKLPTLVIAGEIDPATPVAAHEAIHRAIPGSKLVVMPGVSHMLSAEAPDAFHGHVLPFLAAHGPT